MVTLSTENRLAKSKGEAKGLRRSKKIPAILYGMKGENLNITVDLPAFEAVLREIPKGSLSTTKFELDIAGKKQPAVVKEIQYSRIGYNILHLDFEALDEKATINVNVPIRIKGDMDCVGIKLGGVLRRVIRSVRVNCLPKDMPTHFTLDVASLGVKQSKRVSDIDVPEGVRMLSAAGEVVVLIAKR